MAPRAGRRAGRRALARFLSIAFFAAIAAPGALLVAGRDETKDVKFEFRPPAPSPGLPATTAEWDALPNAIEGWFGDRFGLRGDLLRLRARIHWYALRTSPSDLMLRAADDGLMPTSSGAIENSSGLTPLTEREVDDWLDAIEARSRHLAARGIVHLVALAPDKSSAYPERLPWNHRAGSPRRAAQLAARAEQRGMRQFIDLLPALVAGKSEEREGDPLYYPLGPHWTTRGSVIAALAIRERLCDLGVPLAPIDPAEIRYGPTMFPDADSWAGRLYLDGALRQEFLDGHVDPDVAAVVVHRDDAQRLAVFQRPGLEAPTITVFHDSFGEGPQPHLSRAAWRAIWYWRPYEESLVDAYVPDAVVELFCERLLTTRLPPQDDPSGDAARRAAFDAARVSALVVSGEEWAGRLRRHARRAPSFATTHPGDLVFDDRDVGYQLDLAPLPRGEDLLVRVTIESSSAGRLGLRLPWSNGPATYRVSSLQRREHALAKGSQEIVFHLPRQRTSDVIDVGFTGGAAALRLVELEARILDRAPRQPPSR